MTISALNRASNQPIGLERQKELIAKDQKNTAEKINTLDEKIRLLDENDKNIKSVYESLKALKDPQTLHARTLTLGDPDNKTLQATAAPNAQLGKQTITVSQIAAPTRIAGSIRQASTISTETISKNSFETGPFLSNINLNSLKTGTLSLSVQSPETHTAPIYGTFEIEFSDTLQDVFTKINHATQGDIEATYDPETDKISLTSQSGKDITIGSPEDTSNFWTLTRLFSTHHNANNGPRPSNLTTTSELPLSALNLNETIISTELKNHALLKTGPQTLTINGQSIDYNIQKDSLNAIMKRIQSSTANAELTYDRTTDSFTLTNRETGDINLHFSDPGGLLKAIGLATDESTYIPGKNAQFTINKGPLLSAHKNEIDITTHSITGLTLSLQSLGEQTIEITPNLTEAKKSIQDFVEKYNQYTTFVTEKTENKIVNGKVVKAPLNDRPEAIQLRNAIRRIITQTQVENPTIKTVEALGLSPSTKNIKDPKLYLNETRLSQILTESPQETLVLLETVSQSLQNTLEPNVNPVIKQQNTGSIKTSQDALRNEKSRLQEAQNKRMAEIEKLTLKYELQMMQAEEAQQNMMQALTMLQQAQAKF